MPAEVENLFYVSNEENGRFVPWHGLGTAVSEAPTSAEAIKLAGLDWDVVPKPVDIEGRIIPNTYGNERSSDKAVLGIVTGRYKIVQNRDAFDFTDNLISGDVKYETAGSLKGGKRIWLLARLPEKKILDDEFIPYICFTNSHDGYGSVKACMTPTRVVCNNTLNLALETAKRTWSTKHIGNLLAKMEEAKKALEMADEYMDALDKKANELANITIDTDFINKVIKEIFPLTEDMSDRQKNNIISNRTGFINCYFAPDIKKFQNTAYGLVNAASDFQTHRAAQRATQTYQENIFNAVLDGNNIIDKVYNLVSAR